MKIARFVLAGFGSALALMTMRAARAEVVTIAPDGSIERSENAAVQQQYGTQATNQGQQTAPQYDLATPEMAAGMSPDGSVGNAQRPAVRDNNRRDRDNYRDRDSQRDRNRGDRDDNDRRRRYRNGNIIINGNNTDVYIGGYPGYNYGYRDPYFIDPGYGYPYYGGTYSSGGTTITYGNGLYGGGYYGNGNFYNYGYGNTFQSGRTNPGMGPAWPNMGPVPGMGITNLNPPQAGLPGAIYNPGRRR